MLKLVWRASALDDLTDIITYIADRNHRAAVDLQSDIEMCSERLPEHPFLYRRGRVDGTREAVVHPNYSSLSGREGRYRNRQRNTCRREYP